MNKYDFEKNIDIAWCPGCGNFGIRKSLLEVLDELGIDNKDVVISSGIGQAAKMPQYVNTNYFNGLHGRGLPVAVAIKMSNPKLTVIAEGGDGDMYGEGGNHLIHNIRRNPDITHIVHNNMVYGLTKGQASPTSQKNFKTPLQVDGVINMPFNPIAVALSLGATFVARVFSGNNELTKKVLKEAINHKGYALVDIFQPCVTFNKTNTFAWYKNNSYELGEEHDPKNFESAIKLAFKSDKYPLGIIYKKTGEKSYNEKANVYEDNDIPIIERKRSIEKVNSLI